MDSQNEPKLDLQTQVSYLEKSVTDLSFVVGELIDRLAETGMVWIDPKWRPVLSKVQKRLSSIEKARTVQL